jgi:hypothetical protein
MNNVSDPISIPLIFWETLATFWWLIFPITFFYIFKILWIDFTGWYSDNSYTSKQEWSLFEIIPPREIEKGPQMMESIFKGMTGVLTTFNVFSEYLEGAWYHDRFSLELVGAEGKMHFYIRAQKKYRNMIEAQVYAQYPDAKVLEVEDYTKNFPKVIPNRFWDLWGADFEFMSKDPIPIKTYDRFEESVTGEMNDPLSAVAEVLGTLAPGQHMWLQYVLQPLPEGEKKKYLSVIAELKGEKVVEPKNILQHLVDVFVNIPKAFLTVVNFEASEKKELQPLEFRLSPVEKEVLKATEENLGKNLFRTKMRMIYLGRKENFNRPMVGTFIGALKQFNDINFNQFKPEDISKTYGHIFFVKKRADFRKRKIYNRYRKRNMDDAKVIFSEKELATLFHFPDSGVKSPAVPRVSSKLGSAPINLPVE